MENLYTYNLIVKNINNNKIKCLIDCGFNINTYLNIQLEGVHFNVSNDILNELSNKILHKKLLVKITKYSNIYYGIFYLNGENINEWLNTNNLQNAIIEHGEFLGMTFPEDNNYLWIAKASLEEKLPVNWVQLESNGSSYYVNKETKESIWEHPTDHIYREMYKREKMKKKKIIKSSYIRLPYPISYIPCDEYKYDSDNENENIESSSNVLVSTSINNESNGDKPIELDDITLNK